MSTTAPAAPKESKAVQARRQREAKANEAAKPATPAPAAPAAEAKAEPVGRRYKVQHASTDEYEAKADRFLEQAKKLLDAGNLQDFEYLNSRLWALCRREEIARRAAGK